MADTIEEMESELAHHGVKGMKWGVNRKGEANSEKKQTRLDNRADKGDAILSKSNGNGTKAIGKIAGRRLAVAAASVVVNKAASQVFKNKPAVAKGIQLVSNYANAGMAVKDIVDVNRVVTSERRTERRQN